MSFLQKAMLELKIFLFITVLNFTFCWISADMSITGYVDHLEQTNLQQRTDQCM